MSDYITIRVDKDYRESIAANFRRFQHEEKFWDCKIIVGTETLYCHSCIVSSLSPVIEEMIESKIKDGSEKKITFEDVQPDVMRKITNYMYTGSVTIPNKLVLEVVQVCDELKIEDLKERCLYRVPEILSHQTVMGWLRYARLHKLDSICDSCERYIAHSFSDITKEKFFIRCSLDDLKTTLQDLKGVVSPEYLLTYVLSWINYDKKSRKKALDYTSRYLKLKDCSKQFLTESAKVHIDIFQSNHEFNRRVTHILYPPKLTVAVIGGLLERDDLEKLHCHASGFKLRSETHFDIIAQIPCDLLWGGPSICYYDWNKLLLTGGKGTGVCVMLDLSTSKWKKMKKLSNSRCAHASVSILQQLFVFGGLKSRSASMEWFTSVEFLNIEQEHGEWQSAPPIPSTLEFIKITSLDTNAYLMGENNSVVYLFDMMKKVWSEKTKMLQNPGRGFSIAAGDVNLYVAGGEMKICWQYNFSTDSWTKLSSPSLRRSSRSGALIFHQNSLLLVGGGIKDIEGYATEADLWAVAPYKLPEMLYWPYVFMLDLGV